MGARLRAVLFDWGGTLTPHHEVDKATHWRAAARHLAGDEHVDTLTAALLAAEDETWLQTIEGFSSSRTEEIIASALAAVELEASGVEDALSSYRATWTPYTQARTEAVEVLTAIRDRGLATGLLSNTHWPSQWHEEWLERDGLSLLLDGRVYTCELEHVKPHARAFGSLLELLRLQPSEAVFVGDRHLDDVDGAHAVGMRTVHIDNGATPPGHSEPDARIGALADLLPLLDAWL